MKRVFVAAGLCLMALIQADACADDEVLVRPQVGIGSLDGGQYRHAGLRILFDASADKKYGLELTRVNTRNGDYVAAGIVLEKRKFGWFNMSIGTIGYLAQGSGGQNVPGLVANLGWEPEDSGAIKPFVTMRNDVLFGSKRLAGTALSAGVSVRF
jgi:hypothetical protein